jgi:Ca2+-binding EF-hand superfamily protein
MSDLQQRKYRQWFHALDVDGDGTLTRRDTTLASERYIAAQGVEPDSRTARRLNDLMDSFWVQVIALFDRDGDGCVDLKEMTAGFQQALDNPARYPDQIQPIADHYFDLADIDSNDKINLQEFTQIFGVAGRVSDEDCADVFRQLDLDGSDALSRSEYHRAVIEFFYGDDPDAPTNHLFGRLPN